MTKELFLYSKTNCQLCDRFKSELDLLNVPYHVIMIDNDLELSQRYGARVPVLESGNTLVCEGHIQPEKIRPLINN